MMNPDKRWIALGIALLMVISAGIAVVTSGTPAVVETAAAADWGLSFQKEGEAPLANATSEYLKTFNALYVGDPSKKEICITFDAGFENGNTEKILDALKKHNVKAVFFLVGNYLETEPDLVRRMVEEGHIIGNHTYSHPDMSKIEDAAAFTEELQKNEALYREITGQEMMKLYRPPQGKFCEANLQMASDLGYTTVFWSLAYVDWLTDDQPAPEQAYAKLLPRIHPGAVVLLHSTSETNAAILDDLLTKWKEMGYTFTDIMTLCS